MELVIFLIVAYGVVRAWQDSKAAYRRSRDAYMSRAAARYPSASRSRRAARALRHDAGYWASQALGGFPATRHGFAAGWHRGRAAQVSARAEREEARTRRLENQADHAERLSGLRERQQEALRRWRRAMDADRERATEGVVTGEEDGGGSREGSGEGSPARPGDAPSPAAPESPAPRVCVACGNPEYGPRRGGGNWGPLVAYSEPMFDGDDRVPRLIHRQHFEDESSGFHGRPYEPAPDPDGELQEGSGPPEPAMPAMPTTGHRDCDLCGLPLGTDGDGYSHERCIRVYSRDSAAQSVHDDRPLEVVEQDLRGQGRCPYQTAYGWGEADYCGQPIVDSGGDRPDEFCPQHQAEANGDDEEAAGELNAHVRSLLEADEQESPASAQETPTEGEATMPGDIVTSTPAANPAYVREYSTVARNAGGTMPASDVTYDSVSASMTAETTAADQRAAEQRQAAARASALAEQMQALEVDPATLSALYDHLDAQDAASNAQQRVQETAAAVSATLKRGHAGLNEAHQNAPVQAADREFYAG